MATDTAERLDLLDARIEEVLQLVERLIEHVLPNETQSDEYRAENAQALNDWPEGRHA